MDIAERKARNDAERHEQHVATTQVREIMQALDIRPHDSSQGTLYTGLTSEAEQRLSRLGYTVTHDEDEIIGKHQIISAPDTRSPLPARRRKKN